VDVHGGFHDAGDHVRFGLPQSYTAGTLGWGFYEFRESFRAIGEEEHMIEILRYFTDTFYAVHLWMRKAILLLFATWLVKETKTLLLGTSGVYPEEYLRSRPADFCNF